VPPHKDSGCCIGRLVSLRPGRPAPVQAEPRAIDAHEICVVPWGQMYDRTPPQRGGRANGYPRYVPRRARQHAAVDGEVVLAVAGPKSCFSSGSRSAPNVVRVWAIARRPARGGGHPRVAGCGGDGRRRSRVGTEDVAVAAAPKPRPWPSVAWSPSCETWWLG
jgi:hypothetical protein